MKRTAVLAALLLTAAGLPVLASSPAVAATPTADQALFVPVEPVRLLDTRTGTGAPAVPVGAGQTIDLLVADGVRVPASATAVVLNVTATRASAPTDVRVYPTTATGTVPLVSSLNVVRGLTVANQVTVKVGEGGRVRLRNASGAVDLLADLSGYTVSTSATATSGASSYVPAPSPVRLLDTRDGAPVGPREARRLDVRTARGGAASGVPAGATAVVLNVTAVAPTSSTDVRVYPNRVGAVPTVSTLNTTRGRTVPNLVTVAVGDLSSVLLRNEAGSVHLLADLAGWYVPGDAGAAFRAVDPVRLLDTREQGGVLAPGETRDVQVAGKSAVPSQAEAVVLNVTAVGATGSTDVRVYPTPAGGFPEVSNLNLVRGQTVPNAVAVAVGRDGSVRLRNASATLHLVVDLAGWYLPTGDGWDISWPQCTTAGSTTSRLPEGGAFSMVGLTRSRPFSDNECFAAQWAWASSLPGEPAVYLNIDAPGAREQDSENERVWAQVCGTGTPTNACGREYGTRVAQYVLPKLPTVPGGGRPMVWFDVEGPYAEGPFWQAGRPGVNASVIEGAINTLDAAGYRVGIYSDRNDSSRNDWRDIVGGYRLTQRQNWVFRAGDTETAAQMCAKDLSFSGGPAVMVQLQPNATGLPYDVDHLC